MRQLQRLEHDILTAGKSAGPELELLRRRLYADGKIDRPKADFLVALHQRMQQPTPAFEQFFYRAIKDHMLADGWIDGENAAWLRRMLHVDGKIHDEERKFLHDFKVEANKVSREFERLFDECMNQPQDQPSCR